MARNVCRGACLLLLVALVAQEVQSAPLKIPASELPEVGKTYNGPQQGPIADLKAEWIEVQVAPIPGINAALYPGSDDIILYQGRPAGGPPVPIPYDELLTGYSDLVKGTFTNVTTPTVNFCSALQQTADGKLLSIGGSGKSASGIPDGRKSIRVFDMEDPSAEKVLADMFGQRWYPTTTLLSDGTIMIHGGTQATSETGKTPPYWELYDPAVPAGPTKQFDIDGDYLTAIVQDFYPFNYLLPTGDVWVQQNSQVRIVKPDGTIYMDTENTTAPLPIPGIPEDILTQYPRSGTSVMLPLTYEDDYSTVKIVVMGGVSRDNQCRFGVPDAFQMASRKMFTMTVTWEKAGDEYKYTFSDWEEEDMAIARSGADSTLLPNGDFVITNGGQTGCPGGTSGGVRRNNYPAFWPVLYQPDLPQGQRTTILPASPLARMYHPTAILTRDGWISIAGCDSCGAGNRPAPDGSKPGNGLYIGGAAEFDWWKPSRFGRLELRDEIFKPPYALDYDEMPAFKSIKTETDDAAIVTVTYGEVVPLEWVNSDKSTNTDLVDVTSVSLVAPSAATHGFNNNQRVVFLPISEKTQGADSGSLSVTMPPNANIAPPQMYLMFLMHGKTYGRSRWVHLKPE